MTHDVNLPLRTFLFVSLCALFSCIFFSWLRPPLFLDLVHYMGFERRDTFERREIIWGWKEKELFKQKMSWKVQRKYSRLLCSPHFCCAGLAWHCSSVGRAYHYLYLGVGEGIVWLIGWALILEYTIDSSVVARDIFLNLALFLEARISYLFF